jgi:tetratricopeptide (TPR) repeat protein
MTTQYLCIQCDKSFAVGPDEKPRCPHCMRTTSLEKLGGGEGRAAAARSAPWRGVALGLVVAAVVIGGYVAWASGKPAQVSGDAPLGALTESEVLGYLARENVPAEPLARFLRESDAAADFGKTHAEGASPAEKTASLVKALRARAEKNAFVRWSASESRTAPFLKPADVARLVAKDNGRARLHSLELALFAVTALRSVGVPAVVIEIASLKGERAPLDPTGRFGYFGVAVYDGEPGKGAPHVFDPWGGAPEADVQDTRALTDVETLAAVRGHQASWLQHVEGKVPEALAAAAEAVRLDKRSPSLRAVHGSALSYAGAGPEAVAELEAAYGMRTDGPRRVLKAQLAMAQGNVAAATEEVDEALSTHPEFAEALVLRAQIRLAQRDVDAALRDLDAAEHADPQLATIALVRADVAMATGRADEAAKYAERALVHAQHNWQVRLKAAWIFRAAGRYDEMRREAKLVMSVVPEAQRESMKRTITSVLGPTALEDDGADDAAPDSAPAEVAAGADTSAASAGDPAAAGELKLGSGSGLLGGGAKAKGPSLLGSGGGGLELKLDNP